MMGKEKGPEEKHSVVGLRSKSEEKHVLIRWDYLHTAKAKRSSQV